jgi:hypothetical protein
MKYQNEALSPTERRERRTQEQTSIAEKQRLDPAVLSVTKMPMWKLDDNIRCCDIRYEVPLLQNDPGIADDSPASERCQLLPVLLCLTAVAVFSRLTLLRLLTLHYLIV